MSWENIAWVLMLDQNRVTPSCCRLVIEITGLMFSPNFATRAAVMRCTSSQLNSCFGGCCVIKIFS